jgi:chromosome segregation protein
LARIDRELTVASSEKSILSEGIEVDQRRAEILSERLAELNESAGALGADLDRDTSAAAMLETTSERLRRVASVAQERGRAVSGRRDAAVERRQDLCEESAAIDEELEGIESERHHAESAASSAEGAFRRLEDEERAISTQNSLSPEGALAAVRGELSALESSLSRDGRELEKVAHRIDVLSSQTEEEQREIARINTEIQAMDSEIGDLQKRYGTATAQRAGRQEAWSGAEEILDEARIELASAKARVEAISSALEGRFDAGAHEAIESASGALGSLSSQLDIPEGLEVAVTAALGEWADAVAFADADSVQKAVEIVKGSGGGSVSVVSAMSETAAPASEVASVLGLEALVERLGPSCHIGLATRLLGDVVLVEGWGAGWALISKHPALRAVTPEGDVISVSGVRIADPDGVGSAMLETAEVAAEQASIELARAESIHTAAKRDFEKSREVERQTLETLEQAESGLAGHSEAMNRLQSSVKGLEQERARLEERRASLEEAIEAGNHQVEVLRSRLAALEGEEADRLAVWEEMEARRAQLAADRESARSRWQEATSALRAVVERQRLLQDRRRRIDDELARLDLGEVAEVDPARLERVGEYAHRALATLEMRIEELRDRQAGLRERTTELRAELETVRGQHRERVEGITEARSRIGEIDVSLTELRLKKESVVEAVRRDADADVEEAMRAPRPDLPDDTDLETLMEDLVTRLRRLGPINPLAAGEYRDLEERHTFLSEQMADVESSRAELRKVIHALETEIQNRFDSAFGEVAQAYEKYFEVLFPGGRGEIRLVDPDDPQSGVSIDAQPLGKKVSEMTLLSGGERSLAALAFLFAVFEARPSPFYVLDEVEAALDDTNLRRFLRIVDEFRQRAQLIIVTHQQQTMGAADVLYGVTMEPGGSSNAIRKDMREAMAAGQVA